MQPRRDYTAGSERSPSELYHEGYDLNLAVISPRISHVSCGHMTFDRDITNKKGLADGRQGNKCEFAW